MNELMMSNPDGKGLRPVVETIEDEVKVTLQGMDQKRLDSFKET